MSSEREITTAAAIGSKQKHIEGDVQYAIETSRRMT